ncbi:hypothetical protein NDU88_002630 [Pleurodeles waltl]|uniref:Uncharacterized protein n=1 Tax=Pleurodeles waltl TaxID=8319 RepID=A0AAV7UXS8_PLEWA|nr:hypothetical protein NDU88_002630 [Pleurodeles waltl]
MAGGMCAPPPCQAPPRHRGSSAQLYNLGRGADAAAPTPTGEERQERPGDAGLRARSRPRPPAGVKRRGPPHSGEPHTAPAAPRLRDSAPQRADDIQPETLWSRSSICLLGPACKRFDLLKIL